MAPGFELMGWLRGAQAAQAEAPTHTSQPSAAAAPGPQTTSAASAAPAPGRIAAPHSQAAAALAAALSAGGVPEKKQPQPHGTPISPLQEVLEVDRTKPDSATTLVVSKIANVKSEISRRHGHAIAVDANYICYGLKGGQIRILNKHTAARTLLKDHAAPVTDLRFFRHDSDRCLLASVDTTGQVHVRLVFEEDTGGEDTVRDEILARHELPIPVSGPAAHPPARLAWHPTYDFVLAVAAGPTIYLINVPPTADVAAAPEYAAPVAAASSDDGAIMTSVAFSPAGDLLAAGDAKGYVYVWALTPEQMDPALIQPLASEPDIRFQAYGSAPGEAPYGDGAEALTAVVSLHWLPRGGGAALGAGAAGFDTGVAGGGDGGGGEAQLVLLTGDGVNAHLKLWAIDLSSKPQCTHALRLVSAGGGDAKGGHHGPSGSSQPPSSPSETSAAFFNHLETQPMYDCVVLANEVRSHVYVLHVDLDTQPCAPYFNYVSEFSVKLPILSCTLVPEAFVDEGTDAEAFRMYTIQSDAVQQYTLVPAQCFPMPLPAPPAGGSPGAAATSTAAAAGQYHLPHGGHAAVGAHGAGAAAGATTDGSAAARASRDPLAALLALQQQQQMQQQQRQQEKEPEAEAVADESSQAPCASAVSASLQAPAAATAVVAPMAPMPPSMLLSAASDVSDATSPLKSLPVDAGAGVGISPVAPVHEEAAGVAPGTVAAAVVATAVEQSAELEAAVEAATVVAVESQVVEAAAESLAAATEMAAEAEDVGPQALAELPPMAAPQAPPPPPPPSSSSRQSLLLTPSQLLQSAAAAAARSAASSSVGTAVSSGGTAGAGAMIDGVYGTKAAAAAAGDDESVASTAGTSREHSLRTMSNMTPTMSDANLAAAVAAEAVAEAAAAEAEAEAEAAEAAKESAERAAADAEAVADVASLPSVTGVPPGVVAAAPPLQKSPVNLPPLPSEQLVRRISQSKGGALPPSPSALLQRPLSAPPPSHPTALPLFGADGGEAVGGAAGVATAAASQPTPAAVLDTQSQQQLAQLLALQQQLLDQVSAGQRELLKTVKAEAQRNAKAAADAAATRAAEVVARKAAEERRRESAELQKALTTAVNGAAKDIAQRVADAAAATTAAVKAAIGPAVRAAVAEALPAALSAGATATALERALGSQLTASLPRAVADGLGAAFTSAVVPPLERATSTMFGQMEGALRSGLDTHLGPLAPLVGLSSQLRDAATQVQSAAKALKTEAAAAQQAAAAAARAASAVAAPAPAVPAAAAASSSTSNAKGGAKGPSAAAGSGTTSPPSGPAKPVSGGVTSAAAAAALAAAAAAAGSATKSAPGAQAPARQQAPAPAPVNAGAGAAPAASAVRAAAAGPAPAAPAPAPAVAAAPSAPAPAQPPASVDSATVQMVLGLIRSGDLDGALSRVLERQDLQLVLWACSAAGGATVLAAEPCPLSQPTLLSLLTFLSYDLTADVDLKIGWIDAILKRLDVREPGLAPHIRGVLDSVKAALAVIARGGGSGATAAKAKQAVHQAIGLIAMLS